MIYYGSCKTLCFERRYSQILKSFVSHLDYGNFMIKVIVKLFIRILSQYSTTKHSNKRYTRFFQEKVHQELSLNLCYYFKSINFSSISSMIFSPLGEHIKRERSTTFLSSVSNQVKHTIFRKSYFPYFLQWKFGYSKSFLIKGK